MIRYIQITDMKTASIILLAPLEMVTLTQVADLVGENANNEKRIVFFNRTQ